jgi:DNA-binding NarL/FixJ family response regulator
MGIPAAGDSLSPAIESVILIERRLLVRECFATCLERASGYNVISFESAETYLERAERTKAGLIVLCTNGDLNDAETSPQISLLSAEDLPVVLIADREDASHCEGA